ncbi:MAG: hypothetical protein ABSE16_07865 [Verrucomicrobiota bacterium]|jgi:hypothetical protein
MLTNGKKLLGVFLLVAVVGFMFIGCSSLRRSEATIRDRLERLTPLGTQYDVAFQTLEHHFSHVQINETTGFLRQEGTHQEVVGIKSIQVHLGEYRNFPIGSTSIDAYWGFDKNGRLIDIWVWKTTDSL